MALYSKDSNKPNSNFSFTSTTPPITPTREFKLEVRWPDSDESDIEVFSSEENRQIRVSYLKTIPRIEGVTWKLIN